MAHTHEAARLAGGFARTARITRSLLAGVGLGLALAACGAGEGLDGSFGAQDTGVAPGVGSSLAGGTGSTGSAGGVNQTPGRLAVGSGPDALEYDCPSVTVRTGAAAWQVTDPSGGLRYQGSIGQLARQCAISGGNMTVKVGIEGRLLLGEKGSPGSFKVPIRIAVVSEGPTPRTITTKYFAVPLEIAPGQNQTSFTVVEDQISFPLLKPEEMGRYIIYVGYDPKGETPEKPRPVARSKPKPKPPAEPATASHAPDPGAPKGEVFGPPPGSGSTGGGFAPPPSSGGFAPPPSTSTFSPPPR